MEEELEFPLENGYTLFEEVCDSITLETTYEESVTLLREMHVPTHMDPSHDDLLTWMYKHGHDPLMSYLLYIQLYDVVMYFN